MRRRGRMGRMGMMAAIVLMLAAAASYGQAPKAIIAGPKEARCGALIVLDATASEGIGRLWLLAVAPEETSFLPVESGLKCLFASPTPGRYEFVLVVAGVNANGGPAAEMARHTVTLSGGSPPVKPPDITDPTQPPSTRKPTAATYVYEKDLQSVPRAVAAALQEINGDGSGVVATEFEQDSTTGLDEVPAQYRVALETARKAGLPALVVQAGDAVLRVVKAPMTAEQVKEAVR